MDKTNQFIDFLLGKAEFPYFKDLPVVPYPKGFKPEEDPQDKATELEVEAYLEDKAQEERMMAKEEKLRGKMIEDTEMTEEETEEFEFRQDEEMRNGELDRHSI